MVSGSAAHGKPFAIRISYLPGLFPERGKISWTASRVGKGPGKAAGSGNCANVIMVGAMLVLLFEGALMLIIGDTWKSEGAHNKDQNKPHISARL